MTSITGTDPIRLDHKRVLVTGAASGIGAVTVRKLVARGADVIALDRDAPGLEALREEVPAVQTWTADVADAESLADAVAAIAPLSDGLHGVVASAGISHVASLDDTTPHDWDRVMEVNARGVFILARLTLPLLRRESQGAFVAVASELGLVGQAGLSAYGTSKAAVIQLMRVLAIEHASEGIRFNAVAPGPTLTPMLVRDQVVSGVSTRALADAVPLRRVADPAEIAAAIAFLLSDEASFITGTTLVVDGGVTAA